MKQSKKLKIILLAGAIIFLIAFILFMRDREAKIIDENLPKFVPIKKEVEVKEDPKKEFKRVYKPMAFDKKSCDELKGKWAVFPITASRPKAEQKYFCNIPTTDAGNACLDEVECQGSCLAGKAQDEKGKCSKGTIVLGCGYFMNEGKVVQQCRD
jgi:hypothetical protein